LDMANSFEVVVASGANLRPEAARRYPRAALN
jgi:hypothetical protein